MQRIAVLASGGGSNLQAILDYLESLGERRPGDVVLVASDRAGVGALDRARARGVPAEVMATPGDGAAFVAMLAKHRVDMIALAGYLRLVPTTAAQRYRGRIVNVHPALLPKHGGQGMYGKRVHEAVLKAGDPVTGAAVHFVDEVYDRGVVIARSRVPVESGDTPDALAARVLAAEHSLYPRVVHAVAAGLVSLAADGEHVTIKDSVSAVLLPDSAHPIDWNA